MLLQFPPPPSTKMIHLCTVYILSDLFSLLPNLPFSLSFLESPLTSLIHPPHCTVLETVLKPVLFSSRFCPTQIVTKFENLFKTTTTFGQNGTRR